jgi:hypothetical protein
MGFSSGAVACISLLFLVMAFGSATGLYQLELLGFNLTGMDSGSTVILFLLGAVGAAFVLSPRILRHFRRRRK